MKSRKERHESIQSHGLSFELQSLIINEELITSRIILISGENMNDVDLLSSRLFQNQKFGERQSSAGELNVDDDVGAAVAFDGFEMVEDGETLFVLN